MEITHLFLIYVILFRLAIITAGVISIILGYRLLCKSALPDKRLKQETIEKTSQGTGEEPKQVSDFEAKAGGVFVQLKNANPGVYFALFGAALIGLMVWQYPPEFQEITKEGETLIFRGEEDVTLSSLTQKGINYERNLEREKAIDNYQEAVTLMARPMNHLAWLYQEQGRFEEGLPLTRMAVTLAPNEADFLDTLAVILCKTGKQSEAMDWMEKAAKLNPGKFRKRLEKFQEGSCE